MTIHLSILVFFPALMGLVSAFSPRTLAPKILLIGTLIPLAYTIFMITDFDAGAGLQYVTDDAWIAELGIRYKLGIDGLNLWLILLTCVIAFA
jgi:NADH-quinone oxidoreductase subunit M